MQSSIESEYGSEETSGRSADDSDGRFAGIRRRVSRVFSFRAFLVALVAAFVGMLGGGVVAGVIPLPFVGSIGGLLGLFAAAFLLGAVGSRRRYLEVGVAGGIAAALTFVIGTLTAVFLPFGVSMLQDWGVAIAGAGAGTGAVVSLLGHYFGRDLREGITQEL